MDFQLGTFFTLFLFLHLLNFSQSQPTVQNFFWRNPQRSRGCNNNNNNINNGYRSHHANFRLSSSSGFSSLQNSVDMVLLELQRHTVDTETLRENVQSLHSRHDESRRLLVQLAESVNILVKRLVKTPPCDCNAGDDGDGRGDARRGGGAGGRRREEGGGGGGGGANGKESRPRDKDIDDYVKLFDPSSAHSAVADDSSSKEGVLMDQKETGVLSPDSGSDPTQPDHVHVGEMPRDLRVNQSHAEMGGQDGDQSMAVGTTSSDPTTATGSTTTTADPILLMYNGSVPKDCDDIKDLGYATNGSYVIKPSSDSRSVVVLCEFHTRDVWTLIQRRQDGSQDFYRSWSDYKRGFGDLRSEFWIGNEILHQLTTQNFYRLKIDMWEWPRSVSQSKAPVSKYYFAESRYFYLDSEVERYKLHVPKDYFAYSGFGGSGLRIHAGPFLTKDVKDLPAGMRENCAQIFHCGWWFTTCVRNANFNGRYYKGGYANMKEKARARNDIYWPNIDQSLYRVVMKIGRVNESYAFGG